MGWKISAVIVDSNKGVKELEILNKLGFASLKEIDSVNLDNAIYPDEGKVYIGHYKGCQVICSQYLPMTFLQECVSAGEHVLADYF